MNSIRKRSLETLGILAMFASACSPNGAGQPASGGSATMPQVQTSKTSELNASKDMPFVSEQTLAADPKKLNSNSAFKIRFTDSAGLEWSHKIGNYSNGCDFVWFEKKTENCLLTDEEGHIGRNPLANSIVPSASEAAKACSAIGGRLPTASEMSKMVLETSYASDDQLLAGLQDKVSPAEIVAVHDRLKQKPYLNRIDALFGFSEANERDNYVWTSTVGVLDDSTYKGNDDPVVLRLKGLREAGYSKDIIREGSVSRRSWGAALDRYPYIDRGERFGVVCVRYSEKAGEIPASTPERHVSINGTVFERDRSIPKFGQAYRDPSGRIWSQNLSIDCEAAGGRWPERADLVDLSKYLGGGSQKGFVWTTSDGKFSMLVGVAYGYYIQSITKDPKRKSDGNYVYELNTTNGGVYLENLTNTWRYTASLCISDAKTQKRAASNP